MTLANRSPVAKLVLELLPEEGKPKGSGGFSSGTSLSDVFEIARQKLELEVRPPCIAIIPDGDRTTGRLVCYCRTIAEHGLKHKDVLHVYDCAPLVGLYASCPERLCADALAAGLPNDGTIPDGLPPEERSALIWETLENSDLLPDMIVAARHRWPEDEELGSLMHLLSGVIDLPAVEVCCRLELHVVNQVTGPSLGVSVIETASVMPSRPSQSAPGIIRWLHLTDLHVGMDDQDCLWPRVGDKFRTDLQKTCEIAGPWDLVLFTGDFVQKGREYARLDDIFGEMWEWFAKLGCAPQLLAVPGNHDLQWREAKSAAVKTLYAWEKDSDVRKEFWAKPDGEYREPVNEAFSAYQGWWQNHPKRPGNVQWGLLPGDFSCTIQKGHAKLGIVGLNSAFLQLTEKRGKGSHRGHLVVDPRQFHEACGGDGPTWTRSHHACFLMTHHPPQWLNRASKADLDGEILDGFCLHLCGHNHEADVLQELSGGAGQAPLRWLGRSLFGLEKMENGKLDRSHGYTAGELHITDDGSGYLQFTPRGRVKQGTTWSLVPDHAAAQLLDDRRTQKFQFRIRT